MPRWEYEMCCLSGLNLVLILYSAELSSFVIGTFKCLCGPLTREIELPIDAWPAKDVWVRFFTLVRNPYRIGLYCLCMSINNPPKCSTHNMLGFSNGEKWSRVGRLSARVIDPITNNQKSHMRAMCMCDVQSRYSTVCGVAAGSTSPMIKVQPWQQRF